MSVDISPCESASVCIREIRKYEKQILGICSVHITMSVILTAIRRQVIKPFKFFHHMIDHLEYAETVREVWKCGQIMGTDQFKLIRSLKLSERPLRSLNKRHFSGISQRVKAQE